jgi:hypothetical protein
VGRFQKEVAAALEEVLQVLKVIIFPSPVEASTDSGMFISLWTPWLYNQLLVAEQVTSGSLLYVPSE